MGRTVQLATWLVLVSCLMTPGEVAANPYDISLRGLGRPQSSSLTDPAVQRYRALSNELVFALAPRPLAPAETLGMAGFEFSLVSTTADISDSETYWQGQPGAPVLEGVLPSHGGRAIPRALWVPTAHLRKGLPMSTEIGVNAAYLAWSEMVMLGFEGKVALHESYFRWVPAVSLRGAGSRLMGSSDLDIFAFELDALASLPFGIGGMVQVTPYAGWGRVFNHVNSQVLDETPYEVLDSQDQRGGVNGSLYTFPTLEWDTNTIDRITAGFRINVAMIELLYEFNYGLLSGTANNLQSHSFKIGFDV